MWAIGAVLFSTLPPVYQACLIAALILHCWAYETGTAKTTRTALFYNPVQGWQVQQHKQTHSIRFLPSSVITTQGMVLHLALLGQGTKRSLPRKKLNFNNTMTVLVPADSLNQEDYRRLTVGIQTTWRANSHDD